jgi:DNA-binding NarL/FixJ family response regulator
MIRVLLADDEQLIRQGFRRLLEMFDDVRVVAEAADGEQVLAALAQLEIDVVLLDVRMRRMSGLEVLDAVKARATRPRCLVLTTFDDPELLLEAARRGGFCLQGYSARGAHHSHSGGGRGSELVSTGAYIESAAGAPSA